MASLICQYFQSISFSSARGSLQDRSAAPFVGVEASLYPSYLTPPADAEGNASPTFRRHHSRLLSWRHWQPGEPRMPVSCMHTRLSDYIGSRTFCRRHIRLWRYVEWQSQDDNIDMSGCTIRRRTLPWRWTRRNRCRQWPRIHVQCDMFSLPMFRWWPDDRPIGVYRSSEPCRLGLKNKREIRSNLSIIDTP